jgi:hyperosmotically inducible periplasmic protein
MSATSSSQMSISQALTGLALAVLLVSGPRVSAAAAGGDQPQAHSDSMSAAVSDTATTAKVKARLAGDKRLENSSISVHTTNGVVTLSGTAADKDASSAAEDAAKAVTGVKSVDNEISVPSSGAGAELGQAAHETGHAASDAWITTKIKTQLKTNHSVERGSDISVSTSNGVVKLSGTASSKDAKDQAEAIARNVKGVKSVDASSLRLASSE